MWRRAARVSALASADSVRPELTHGQHTAADNAVVKFLARHASKVRLAVVTGMAAAWFTAAAAAAPGEPPYLQTPMPTHAGMQFQTQVREGLLEAAGRWMR